MMSHQLFLAFIVFAVVMFFTPGPNNIMLLTSGLNFGFRRTLPHLAGVVFGFAFMIAVSGLGLGAVTTLEHPGHRRLEIVIADPPRHSAETVEREHVAFQERLLGLSGERDMKRLARARQPHHEQPRLHQHAGDPGIELAEVDLCLRAG